MLFGVVVDVCVLAGISFGIGALGGSSVLIGVTFAVLALSMLGAGLATGRTPGALVVGTRLVAADTGSPVGARWTAPLVVDVRNGPDPLRRLLGADGAGVRASTLRPGDDGAVTAGTATRGTGAGGAGAVAEDERPTVKPWWLDESRSGERTPPPPSEVGPVSSGLDVLMEQSASWPEPPRPRGRRASTAPVDSPGGNVTIPMDFPRGGVEAHDEVVEATLELPVPWSASRGAVAPPWPGSGPDRTGHRLLIDGRTPHRLPAGGVVLGRDPVVDEGEQSIGVPDLARKLSRNHVHLVVDGLGRFVVTDLRAVNGTYVRREGDGTVHRLIPGRPTVVPLDAVVIAGGHELTLGEPGRRDARGQSAPIGPGGPDESSR